METKEHKVETKLGTLYLTFTSAAWEAACKAEQAAEDALKAREVQAVQS